jgi:hypothetical protein
MYIEKVKTGKSMSGTYRYTYRLVASRRVGSGDPKHRVVLNLGAGYSFPPELWKELAQRVERILLDEQSLFPPRPDVEQEAQRLIVEIRRRGDLSLLKGKGKTPLNGYYLEDIASKRQRAFGVLVCWPARG